MLVAWLKIFNPHHIAHKIPVDFIKFKYIIIFMNNVVQITDQTFNDTINFNTVSILYYYGPRCMPCKAYSPIFEKVAKDYIGKAVFGKINTDEFSFLNVHGIRSLPTTVIVKNQQVVEKISGIVTEESLRNTLAKYL
jgi:thioredoxin-like negative regulator of GroEL